ncbi:MAG: uroporphyrinogen-III synthase [Deltaproteobacteria bacterium]|nr:uroporphyrinogen-III synthase [Deltaproteobacteria bacterium]
MPSTRATSPEPLAGLRVIAFESRRQAELELLLARHGARVITAPALREVPIEANADAVEFVARLERGELDVVILLTGVGTRALVDAVRPRCPTDRLVELLRRVRIVARGPKPVAALRALDLVPDVRVPEPNTWRELLDTLDRELPVHGLRVAVQEYGKANPALLDGLAARGADVLRVPVYRWALPHDLAPLRAAIARLVARDAEVVVFTTAVQLDHLLRVAAESPGGADAVRSALRDDVVVASIGPTVAEALGEAGLPVDVTPVHPKLGWLANVIAEQAPALVAAKRARRTPR